MNMAEPHPPPPPQQHFSRISNPILLLPPPPPYPQGPIILPPSLAAAGQIVWIITPPPPPAASGGLSGVAPCSYSYQCFTPTHQPLPPLTIHRPISLPQRPQSLQVNGKQQTSGSSVSDSSGSRGTGVFLPPPSSTLPPLPIQKPHNNNHHNNLTRCKGIWKRVNKNELKVNDDDAVKEQVEGKQNTTIPSPDLMGLPKEWTY